MTAAQQQPQEGKKSHLATAGLALVLVLAVVAVFAWRGDDESAQLDTPESAVPYVCLACEKVFDLTPAAYVKLTEEGGVKPPADPEQGGVVMLRCPGCAEFAAVGASICKEDGTPFPRRLANSQPGQCPKCGWSYYRR